LDDGGISRDDREKKLDGVGRALTALIGRSNDENRAGRDLEVWYGGWRIVR
jgi:hypothetical protein